ncbi:spherulin-2A-like [Achroia grisella]|uniref:spherulin-2A-like n=1 Tax=Achroia grisella TaxID=688607 RepID=UPI0027D2937D|nr:spherulin-2A-like [Achroia grisella]
MASKFLALLFVLPVIYAKIEVNVVASDNEAERLVELSGSNVDIISDTERNTFQLSDNNLKNAVRSYFGKRPDDAYVKSPTPWGDLYQTYGWPQVARSLAPQRAKVLQVTSNPSIVLTQHFENNSTTSATFKAQIKQEVQNTVTSTWEKGGELTVGQEIEYGFDIKVVSVGGKTSFSYTSKWGESVSKSETVTVGSESGVEITLEPGQRVVAELFATRGTMQIQVDYEGTLSGSTAVNYADTYKGHHFWALDINAVMRADNLNTSAQSREVINLGYYSSSKVVIRDAKSNAILYSLPMSIF